MLRKIYIYIFLSLVATGCCKKEDNNAIQFIPFKLYQNSYPKWVNPLDFVNWSDSSIYIFRDPVLHSAEVIMEVPLKKVNVGHVYIRDIHYYEFDLHTVNRQYVKRKMKKNEFSQSPLRNVKISLFALDIDPLPDFTKLDYIDSVKYSNLDKDALLDGIGNYYFFVPKLGKFFWIDKSNGIDEWENKVIQWMKMVKGISVDDAIFYDQFVSDKTIKDRSSYLSNGTYIIEEIPRSAAVELLR